VSPCSKPPDIAALSETRIKETPLVPLPGYNSLTIIPKRKLEV